MPASKTQSTENFIQFVDKLIKTYGKITLCRSDSGQQFLGGFQRYLEEMGMAHKVSSAYNPSLNASSESSVRLNKLLKKKSGCKDSELEEFIMRANCLVRPDGTGSLAEIFLRWKMRVPGIPGVTAGEADFQHLQFLREEAVSLRSGQDTSHHYKVNFKKGDYVLLQDPLTRLWDQRGVVVSVRDFTVDDASRSYLVNTEGGGSRLKLCNRKFMWLSNSRMEQQREGDSSSGSKACRATFQEQQNRFL